MILQRRRFIHSAGAALAAPTVLTSRAWADGKSIQIGVYPAQQGEYVRKEIIPKFEADYKCRVYATTGVTLTQIAALRATRSNPKYSVMFMDDIGIDLAAKEGLIDPLPVNKLPNLDRLPKGMARPLPFPLVDCSSIRRTTSRLPVTAICGMPSSAAGC